MDSPPATPRADDNNLVPLQDGDTAACSPVSHRTVTTVSLNSPIHSFDPDAEHEGPPSAPTGLADGFSVPPRAVTPAIAAAELNEAKDVSQPGTATAASRCQSSVAGQGRKKTWQRHLLQPAGIDTPAEQPAVAQRGRGVRGSGNGLSKDATSAGRSRGKGRCTGGTSSR